MIHLHSVLFKNPLRCIKDEEVKHEKLQWYEYIMLFLMCFFLLILVYVFLNRSEESFKPVHHPIEKHVNGNSVYYTSCINGFNYKVTFYRRKRIILEQILKSDGTKEECLK